MPINKWKILAHMFRDRWIESDQKHMNLLLTGIDDGLRHKNEKEKIIEIAKKAVCEMCVVRQRQHTCIDTVNGCDAFKSIIEWRKL